MPQAAIMGAIAGGSSLLGALSKSGKQGSQTTTSTNTSNQTQHQTSSFDNLTKTLEPEYFSQFRQQLIPSFWSEMTKANRPVYGTAQKAQFMGGMDKLANASIEAIRQKLGASGATDSGRQSTMTENVELEKMGKISDFLGQLPFMNEQARSGKMQNLLGLGANWTGKAPVDTQQSGSSVMDMLANMTSQGSQETSVYGAPWYKSLLGAGSSLLNIIGQGMGGSSAMGGGAGEGNVGGYWGQYGG